MKRTGGFSITELVVALAIGGLLMSFVVTAVGPVVNRFQVRSAQNSFVSMVAKARAQAIERGSESAFRVHVAGDSAWFESGGDVESYDFRRRNGVELESSINMIEKFMTARGFADLSRGNPSSGSVTVRFRRGNVQSEVTVMPLGQVRF